MKRLLLESTNEEQELDEELKAYLQANNANVYKMDDGVFDVVGNDSIGVATLEILGLEFTALGEWGWDGEQNENVVQNNIEVHGKIVGISIDHTWLGWPICILI